MTLSKSFTQISLLIVDLVTKLLKKKIKIKLDDWVHVMNLKYETHKFNRYDALVNMIRLELYKHPCTDAKSLIVEE